MDKKSTTPLADEAEFLSRDLHAFMVHALKPEIYTSKGQRFMSCLRTYRPDLAIAAGGPVSVADEALPVAIAWVRDNWDKTREKSGGG